MPPSPSLVRGATFAAISPSCPAAIAATLVFYLYVGLTGGITDGFDRFSEPIEDLGRGIAAGCTLSTSLARAYICRAINNFCADNSGAINVHVDDMQQAMFNRNSVFNRIRAVRAIRNLGETITSLGLTVSGKTHEQKVNNPDCVPSIFADEHLI